MKVLILDGLFVHRTINDLTYEDRNVLDIINESAKAINFDRIILLQNGNITKIPDGIKNVIINNFTPLSILTMIEKEARNCDDILIYDVGNPFFDSNFIETMFKRHQKFLADYTYCLGYPDNLTPVILRKDIIKEMLKLVAEDDTISKNYLFYTISKDINSFDIETFLSEYDLRLYRLKIGASDQGEIIFTKKLVEEIGLNSNYEHITEYCFNNLDKLYTTIYMLSLELTNQQNLTTIYQPQEQDKTKSYTLDFNLVKKIVDDLKNKNDKITIVLNGLGEPFLYSDLIKVIKLITENSLDLIIETNGHFIDQKFIDSIKDVDCKLLKFVVKLDAFSEVTYLKIHQDGDFQKVIKGIELLEKSGFQVYKQIVRMLINEEEIEQIIRNNEMDNVILRKYSTFCGSLTDKKVVDLAPLNRIPCFHLRRELFIRADSKVSTCIYAYNNIIGDLKKDSLDFILKEMEKNYIKNTLKEYNDFCSKCDDYYLFNF